MYTYKTDIKFIRQHLFKSLLILFFILCAFIILFRTNLNGFIYLSKFIVFALAFYLVINAYTTRFISQNVFLSSISFFYGLVNLLQGVSLALSYVAGLNPHAPEIASKIYFVARTNFMLMVFAIVFTLFHTPRWLKQVCFVLFTVFWISVILVFNTPISDFFLFLTTDKVIAHIIHFASNIMLIASGFFAYYFIYKKRNEIPQTHVIILCLFFACVILIESVNIFKFLPFTHSPLMTYLYKITTLYLLIIGQIDCCILRPFKSIYIEHEEKVEAFDKALKIKNESYEKLIELIPDPVLLCNLDHIVSLNAAASHLFKDVLDPSIVGKSILTYLDDHSDNLPRFFIHLGQNATTSGEGTLIINSATHYAIEYTFTTTLLHEHIAVIAILRDVTQKKKQQETEKSLYEHQLKLNYFSNISHDIKTPINIIYSALQVQQSTKSWDSISKYNTIMQTNCLKLLKMVNNILDINKLDNAMLIPRPIVINIISFIESLCELSLTYMQQKHISYIFDTNVDEKYIKIDIDLLERIIFNILSNAIKYSPEGSTIFITLTDELDTLAISVRDMGLGIPNDKINTIFERFITLSAGHVIKQDSCGIGLSIVKDLLDLLQGSISCYSTLGEGSEFIIKLPTPILEDVDATTIDPDTYSSPQAKLEFCDL